MYRENKKVMTKETLLRYIKNKLVPGLDEEFGEVLITAGAGDIDMLVNPIKEMIEKELAGKL